MNPGWGLLSNFANYLSAYPYFHALARAGAEGENMFAHLINDDWMIFLP